jgi:hypothetical protein
LSDEDYHGLIEEIEGEAKVEGPAAKAELRNLRREFSTEAERMAAADSLPRDHS